MLLLANFFLLEIVDDPRWGAVGSTLLAAVALIVAISDPEADHTINRRQSVPIVVLCPLAPIVLFVNSESVVGLAYLLPVGAPRDRDAARHAQPGPAAPARHPRDRARRPVLSTCFVGLLFAFVYLAVDQLRDAPFFAQPGPHQQSEYLYFSFVALTTLGFGDLSPAVGLPQALTALEALLGQVFLVTLVARLVTLWVRQGE